MKNLFNRNLIIAVCLFFISVPAFSQCDTIASICSKHIDNNFISDGQAYRALLLDDEVAEFHATLFGGTTYRLAGCSGLNDGNLIFRVLDQERNILFSNKEFTNAPYWDLQITSTLDVIIEAQLESANLASGCAVLLISFKQ